MFSHNLISITFTAFIWSLLCYRSISAASVFTGSFWHVSDLHYDPTYWAKAISCKSGDIPDHGHFGSHLCDSPFTLIQDAVQTMTRLQPNPDFIIWTGDNALHFTREKQTMSEVMHLMRNVTDLFASNFPSIPVIPSLGNHDFVPKNQAGTNYTAPYGEIAEMWKQWIEDESQLELFRKGGYFSKQVSPTLLALSVNTILYYVQNDLTVDLDDPADQFQWLIKVLDQAKRDGVKVIVTGHVMPGLRTPGLEHLYHPAFSRRYVDIMTNFSDVIVASHYGHEHEEVFKLLRRDDSPPEEAVTVFSAMSVTPKEKEFKPGQPKFSVQPSVRLVEYDRTSGRHLNYRQFYTNLTESNLRKQTSWTELYNFRDTYNVPDMSVGSVSAIYSRMIAAYRRHNATISSDSSSAAKATPDNPFSSYCRHILGPTGPQECERIEQAEIWCGGQTSDLVLAQKCVKALTKYRNNTGIGIEILKDATNVGPLAWGRPGWLCVVTMTTFKMLTIVLEALR